MTKTFLKLRFELELLRSVWCSPLNRHMPHNWHVCRGTGAISPVTHLSRLPALRGRKKKVRGRLSKADIFYRCWRNLHSPSFHFDIWTAWKEFQSLSLLSECSLFPTPPGLAVWRLPGDSPLLPRGTRLPQEGAVRSAQLPAEHGASRRGVDGWLQGALLQPQPPGQEGRRRPWCRGCVGGAVVRNVWSGRLHSCKDFSPPAGCDEMLGLPAACLSHSQALLSQQVTSHHLAGESAPAPGADKSKKKKKRS